MNLLADENMAALTPLFAPLGRLRALPGRDISATDMADVEALLVRSVTRVDASLLAAAPKLRFVGTATIGTDHLDLAALSERGIRWANAPGCNAEAVGEWVLQALLVLALRSGRALRDCTLGIVGVGNTGSAVLRRLKALGVRVLCCDPLRQAAGDSGPWFSLDQLLAQCDGITLHVPLVEGGANATRALLDQQRLAQLGEGAWLLNASRGEVIDNRALVAEKRRRPDLKLALDVWEQEPLPMPELVELADIATPHIAGYSLEGKIRGSLMLHCALTRGQVRTPALAELLDAPAKPAEAAPTTLDDQSLLGLLQQVFDLEREDERFRAALPGGFDARRKANLARRECSALTLRPVDDTQRTVLSALGFSLTE
ncbi:4-phosphoerythronate dehydrogenase [Ferrimonas gelatinilytica]|uniref:Erythronate-4-phosphate dehydrogenase n=1 Tax=Ferrimonas gelatinilytica TaxID=1255257 RepID=A0ABP9S4G0_9GAMM